MTATALQNSLYPSFGVINSFSIYEYKDTEYEEYALSVLRLANDNLSQSIAHFWKLPFAEKEINYHLLSKLEPLLKVLQKITLEEEVSQEIQREALLFIDNALTYKDLLTDYFEERELLLGNSKRMIAPILIKNLDDEIQTR